MKNYFYFLFLLLILLTLSIMPSCYYDSEEALYGTNNFCDTIDVKYSAEVSVILQNNCLTCHSTAAANSLGAGIVLEGYQALETYAKSGLLYSVISATNSADVMPPSGKMADCNIEKIKSWVDDGALDN